MINRIYEIVRLAQHQNTISGVAIATPGVVEPAEGIILTANDNIPGYANTKVKALVEESFKIPCWVENDVNCALLGELYYGDIGSVRSAVMVTVGTGVGGALFLNGEIYRGSTFSAGEVGYSILEGGTADHTASASALVSRVSAQTGRNDADGQWIFEQAKNGNAICVKEIDALVNSLTRLIIHCVSLVNPEVVILGGGIMEQKEYLKPRIDRNFRMYTNSFVREKTDIRFASLGNKAGMLGAYRHFCIMESTNPNT